MAMESPRPGPAHQNLARLTGTWAGPEQLMPSPENPAQQERHGRLTARMFEGCFLISDYEQRDGDAVVFRGHGVYSFDAEAEQYVMHWFDSMGGAGCIARGHMEGDQLTFRSRSPAGHHRYRYTLAPDATVFEMATSPDGAQWRVLMIGRYARA